MQQILTADRKLRSARLSFLPYLEVERHAPVRTVCYCHHYEHSLSPKLVAQTLPAPQAITDPKKISSKPNAQVEPRSLTIEKLYMTRQIGQRNVVARWQEHRVHLEHERTQ